MKNTFRLRLYQPVESQKWVVHKKLDAFDVYIGRPTSDTSDHFGNPFGYRPNSRCSVLVETPEEALTRHDSWLRGTSDQNLDQPQRQWVLGNINSLRCKYLGCFCAKKNGVGLSHPKVCHGQNYLQVLHELDQGILRLVFKDDLYSLVPAQHGALDQIAVAGPTYSKLTGIQRERVRFDLMSFLLTLPPNSSSLHVGDCNGVDKLVRDGAKTARFKSVIYRKNPLLSDKVQVAELLGQLVEGVACLNGRFVAWVNDLPSKEIEPSDSMELTTNFPLWEAIAWVVGNDIPLTLFSLDQTLSLPTWVPKEALLNPSPGINKSNLHQRIIEILTRWLFLSGTGNSQINRTVEDRYYRVVQSRNSLRLIAILRDCPIFQVENGSVTLDGLVTEDLENLLRLNHQLETQVASKLADLCQQACCVFGLGEFNTGRIASDDNYKIFQAKGILTLTAHDGRQVILKVANGQVVYSSVTWEDFRYFLTVQEHIKEHGRPRKIIDMPQRSRPAPPVKLARL